MRPTKFPGYNAILAEYQDEYQPLPVHRGSAHSHDIVTSCWQLTWWERIRMLFTGKLYLQQMTFGRPLQPQLPSLEQPAHVQASVDSLRS